MNVVDIDHARMMKVIDLEHAYDLALERETDEIMEELLASPSAYMDVTSDLYDMQHDQPIERFLLDVRREIEADYSAIYGASCSYAIKTDRVMSLCAGIVELLKSKERIVAERMARSNLVKRVA